MFGTHKNKQPAANGSNRMPEYAYLGDDSIYLDAACQSMRPQPVIDAVQDYYHSYNACGGRVKYKWGQQVDEAIEDTRREVLGFLKLPAKDYSVSFTLNTTYGLNLILSQLPAGNYRRIITSDIEHNSVFLPTMAAAGRLGIERIVLSRTPDGQLQYDQSQLENAVVVVNAVSNIDGRALGNVQALVDDAHRRGGIVILDAAQAMAHHHELLASVQADAICFSGHKMYATSLGVIVIRKELLQSLHKSFIGGGMVHAVKESSYKLLPDEPSALLEPGLQAFGEIIGFKKALEWLGQLRPGGRSLHDHMQGLSQELYDGLKSIEGLEMFNAGPSSVISVYSPKIDAHRLAVFLSSAGIMVRSGYFCCHYYLLEKNQLPPLLRFSIGLHNTSHDVQHALKTMRTLIEGQK